ncbi:MAG: TetR/AcrR family transcriptional regulator [Alteromonadaceae bacterium]|nr:TetR/AcrR family transcriptional regulator [Alteromonadaceae bacterium]
MAKKDQLSLKKQPVQQRSVFMVDVIKQAAVRVLKDRGAAGFTTYMVAEVAGVSVGSLYQYFGSKETLIAEIKRDHFAQLRGLFRQAGEALSTGTIGEAVDKFVDASVEGHLIDPQLHRILSSELGDFDLVEDDKSDDSIKNAIESVLLNYREQLRNDLHIPTAAHLSYHLVEKTVHDTLIYADDADNTERIISELKTMLRLYFTGSAD